MWQLPKSEVGALDCGLPFRVPTTKLALKGPSGTRKSGHLQRAEGKPCDFGQDLSLHKVAASLRL